MKSMVTTLRIPIARLGKWYHPVYKNNKGEPVVEFVQEDFDSIREAFVANDRGYEPYLTYGHIKTLFDKTTIDGFPIEGHLTNLEQVDDVLYGDFRPNNPEVVDNVRSGKYRYASGEFVRGLPSKETGAKVRVFLKGVALTNTPFVPNLPRNAVKLVSEDLAELVLLSESIELGDNAVHTPNTCPECDAPMEDGKCTSCGYMLEQEAADKKMPQSCSEDIETSQTDTKVNSPEITVSGVVEQFEDVKEIKSMLSEAMTWLKELFATKKPELEEPKEELAESAELEPPVLESEVNEEPQMEDNNPGVDLAALEAELAALKDEKARLEADNVALAEAAAAFEQEKLAVEKAAREQELSDKINDLVEAGLAPAVAEKVKALVSSSNDSVIALSEGNEVKLGDALLDLVRELVQPENRVDLEQVGASGDTATLSDDADNPWADVIRKYRDKQSQ